MATTKVKGTSKKIKELKGIEDIRPSRVTEQELAQLQSTVRSIDRLTIDVGRIEIQKYTIVAAMQKVQETIETLRKDFLANYGTDNINLQDGTITYSKTPTPQENGEVNS